MRPWRPARVLGLELINEIYDVVKTSARAGANAPSGDGDGKVGLAGAGSANQHDIALLGDEATTGEVGDERMVDRGVLELEVVEILGERELGDSRVGI